MYPKRKQNEKSIPAISIGLSNLGWLKLRIMEGMRIE